MEIQNGIEGLKTLLGVTQAAATQAQSVRSGAGSGRGTAAEMGGDHATLSAAATEVSQGSSDVRMDKVAAVQAALAAGTYEVPAAAVAKKVVDAMLLGGK
ncbi:MAG TPA: flagellar biosynthesis anti-sigma factor FlgM [Terracidiphilus sp.]|nr:flagellar biosynthesis anti-sigma factor FlgM [Terracidiphilus sp.]